MRKTTETRSVTRPALSGSIFMQKSDVTAIAPSSGFMGKRLIVAYAIQQNAKHEKKLIVTAAARILKRQPPRYTAAVFL